MLKPATLWVISWAGLLLGCSAAASQPDSRNTLASLPDSIDWTENPAIPPGGQLAVLSGQPRAGGLYAFRLKFPTGYKVMPHSHPEDRIYTVLTGTWYIGLGNQFDPASLRAFTAGAVYRVPAGTTHFHWARSGESIVQVVGVGPTATDYVNPAEDPRRK